jgi:hypothetical protein
VRLKAMKLSEITSKEYFKSEKNIDSILKDYLNCPVNKLKDIPRDKRRSRFDFLCNVIENEGKISQSRCEQMTMSEFLTALQYSQRIAYKLEYFEDDEDFDNCTDYYLYDSRMLMQMLKNNNDIVNELYKAINLKAFLEFYRSKVKEEDQTERKLLSLVYGDNPYEEETVGNLLQKLENRAFTCWLPSIKSHHKYVQFIRQVYDLIDWVVFRSFMQLYPECFNQKAVLEQYRYV